MDLGHLSVFPWPAGTMLSSTSRGHRWDIAGEKFVSWFVCSPGLSTRKGGQLHTQQPFSSPLFWGGFLAQLTPLRELLSWNPGGQVGTEHLIPIQHHNHFFAIQWTTTMLSPTRSGSQLWGKKGFFLGAEISALGLSSCSLFLLFPCSLEFYLFLTGYPSFHSMIFLHAQITTWFLSRSSVI